MYSRRWDDTSRLEGHKSIRPSVWIWKLDIWRSTPGRSNSGRSILWVHVYKWSVWRSYTEHEWVVWVSVLDCKSVVFKGKQPNFEGSKLVKLKRDFKFLLFKLYVVQWEQNRYQELENSSVRETFRLFCARERVLFTFTHVSKRTSNSPSLWILSLLGVKLLRM